MKTFRILLGLLLVSGSILASTISGYVLTTEGVALPFVTISLLNPDSSLVTGTISDNDGSFSLNNSSPSSNKKNYILKASYIGYETQCVNLSDATDTIIIRLHEESMTRSFMERLVFPHFTYDYDEQGNRGIQRKNQFISLAKSKFY